MASSDGAAIILILIIVCVALIFAWWRRPRLTLIRSRRIALDCGLVGNTVSLALLVIFLGLTLLVNHGMTKYSHFLWAFSFLFWIAFSVASALCGVFGRGVSRILVIANGILLAALWYIAGLANSP